MPRKQRPLSPGARVLRCGGQGCQFKTTSCVSLTAHRNNCPSERYMLVRQSAKRAAEGAAARSAATSVRSGRAEPSAAAAKRRTGASPEHTENRVREHPAEATARGADGVVSAPAESLVTNLQPSASAPAPPDVLGQQGGQALAASQRPKAPHVSGGGVVAGGGPELCREKPRAAARAPALTPWEAELYRVLRPLPQSKQTEILRVVSSAFPNSNRLRFTDARALKAAYDGEQVSLSPCADSYALAEPAHTLACATIWALEPRKANLHRRLPPHMLLSWSPAPPAVCTAAFSVTYGMLMCRRMWRLVVL